MHKGDKRTSRALLLLLALALMFAQSALAEGSFSAYVKSERAMIYASAWLSSAIGSLKKYTVLTVKAHSGGVAQIEYQGHTGYARVSDLNRVSSIAKSATLNAAAPVYAKPSLSSPSVRVNQGTQVYVLKVSGACAKIEKDGNVGYIYAGYLTYDAQTEPQKPSAEPVVYEEFSAQVTLDDLRVYASPSTSAKGLGRLNRGTVVNVKAYSGGWALIELAGNTGFCAVSGLTRDVADPRAYLTDGKYSNEKVIYMFLVKEVGFSSAAACGVLANIKYESGYRTNATGDNGRSYGICQWFSARATRLKNYCENHSYDYTTLAGQLWFLKYELETYYPKVLRYMRDSVENTQQGAYDAGWYWCYHFEGPASRESVSVTRGNYAKNTVWPRYEDA